MLRLKLGARGEYLIIQLLWATDRLLFARFLVLSMHCHCMNSPSTNGKRGVSTRFHLVVFVYGVNQEN